MSPFHLCYYGTAGIGATTIKQQEREIIAANRAFNDAIQSGSPFKMASEKAAAAAAAARANQNLPAATLPCGYGILNGRRAMGLIEFILH
jgi:hypothetical protein